MNSSSMIQHLVWTPFAQFGFNHPFWSLQANTLISTWVVLGLITLFSLYVSRCLKNESSLIRFVVLQYVKIFQDLLNQSIQSCPVNHLAMIGSFFSFIFLCNTIQFIPWLEEPTQDLNTTLALGLISFFYVQISSVKANGFKKYTKHYFEPFAFMFPLHIIGAFSSIISISFRLFGNIFGGCVISSLYSSMLSGSIIKQTVGLLIGTNLFMFLIFGIFEGLIQAFVFTMLTLTYLSMQLAANDEDTDQIDQVDPKNTQST